MAELIPVLQFLASAGAGMTATWLISWARRTWPCPTAPTLAAMTRFDRAGYVLLYAPRYTRLLALGLAAAIGLIAALALAGLQSTDARPLLDAALAALVSQIRHGLTLSAEVPRAPADADLLAELLDAPAADDAYLPLAQRVRARS